MARANWDDLRYVLAVAETGSVSGAARRLGVNHATVLRRVAAFEDQAGTAIFDKTPRGYLVAPDSARVIDAAREVATAVACLDRLLTGLRAPMAGRIRVTSTDSLSALVLPGVVRRVCAAAPGLEVEILSSNHRTDLARVQAEVAVRPAQDLPDDQTGRAVARLGFAPYVRRGSAEPGPWLALTGVLQASVAGRFLAAQGDRGLLERAAAGADSFLVLAAMAAAGEGVAMLPCIVGDADPRLARLFDPDPPVDVPVWVASHADLADIPRIARFRAALALELAAESDRLAGRAGVAASAAR